MPNLKPITELTAEELLDLLKDNTPLLYNFDYKNDFLDFISVHQITSGENRVRVKLIYNYYKIWSKKPLQFNPFAKEMTQIFESYKISGLMSYGINKPKEYFLERVTKKTKVNKTKKRSWFKHFKTFIDKYNLKPGRFYVKDVVLYNLYDKWVYKNNNRRPLGFQQFLKFCRLFFKTHKMIKGQEWFSMDGMIQYHLSEDQLKLMGNRNE